MRCFLLLPAILLAGGCVSDGISPDCLKISATDGLLVIDIQNSFSEEYDVSASGAPEYSIPPEDLSADGRHILPGSLAVPNSSEIIEPINKWMKSFASAGAAVFASLDWHPEPHCSFCRNGTSTSNPEYYHPHGAVCVGVGKDVKSFNATGRCTDDVAIDAYNENELVQWPDHCLHGHFAARFHPYLQVPKSTIVVKKGFLDNEDSYSAFGGRQSVQPWPFDTADTASTLQDREELGALIEAKKLQRLFVLGLATDYCVLHTTLDALGKDPSSGRPAIEGVKQVVFVERLSRGVASATTKAAVAELKQAGAVMTSSLRIDEVLEEVCSQGDVFSTCHTE
ncbi:hypothetical protein CYMTET_12245 [Cymbomonas tetramitiformis]|uniref:nicotinamidase n=1 Tax=Cymbomonas tetramitiformis TaxID=36881 RepID=A0AAE0GKH2_9CHLO|nr:hypothetical protein CYMTET_12245 [Cymbomonas tetramitiformis]